MKKHKRVATVETVEWIVSDSAPLLGILKSLTFKDETKARKYFDMKKEEKRKELTLIKRTTIKRTTTIEDIEEYA